ncbi:MAG TPA: flagellar basal body rod protein FlgC [Solirubrobacteraceae bacterium]|nr:flagellar basal body rod protein FlgC [Solirubrobacteraceae bacterium]
MGLFDAIEIAGSGLSAERVRMDVTAENLANAQTTRVPGGGPYQRKEVILAASAPAESFEGALEGALGSGSETQEAPASNQIGGSPAAGEGPGGGVQVAAVVASKTPDQLVYEPGNPEANAKGYVRLPNVDTVTEMTNLIAESRSYQADVTAMETAKGMFNTTLGLLK